MRTSAMILLSCHDPTMLFEREFKISIGIRKRRVVRRWRVSIVCTQTFLSSLCPVYACSLCIANVSLFCHILINFLLYRDLLGYTCYRLMEYELVCGCQNAFRSGIIGYVHPYMRTSHPYMHSVCYASAHVISCSAEVYTNQQITDIEVYQKSWTS